MSLQLQKSMNPNKRNGNQNLNSLLSWINCAWRIQMSILLTHHQSMSFTFLYISSLLLIRITGNWSASSSSARQSLESDFNKSPKKGSQSSLDKDSACSFNLTSSNASDQPSEDRFVLISYFIVVALNLRLFIFSILHIQCCIFLYKSVC